MVPNSTLTAQLARERERDLMAQAQRHRLAAQDRLSSRPWRRRACQVSLRWGRVLIRAFRPALYGKARWQPNQPPPHGGHGGSGPMTSWNAGCGRPCGPAGTQPLSPVSPPFLAPGQPKL